MSLWWEDNMINLSNYYVVFLICRLSTPFYNMLEEFYTNFINPKNVRGAKTKKKKTKKPKDPTNLIYKIQLFFHSLAKILNPNQFHNSQYTWDIKQILLLIRLKFIFTCWTKICLEIPLLTRLPNKIKKHMNKEICTTKCLIPRNKFP